MFVSKEVENLTSKGKERKNGKIQEEERRRREKTIVALSGFILATFEMAKTIA